MNLQQHAADLFGLTLRDEQIRLLDRYTELMLEYNAHTNLTAITDPDEVAIRHHLDSLSVLSAVPLKQGMHIVDIGTGAGFPGLPLHMVSANLNTTLIEATGKKVTFLNHIIESLELKRVTTVHGRAEDVGHKKQHRARYDVVLARAVARLPTLLEYLLPFAKVGGMVVAMKGVTAQQEIDDSQKALSTLGGTLENLVAVQLPGVAEPHYLVIVKKTQPTAPAYPRKPGIPGKMPIGDIPS